MSEVTPNGEWGGYGLRSWFANLERTELIPLRQGLRGISQLSVFEKLATQLHRNSEKALSRLAEFSPNVVITLRESGFIWRKMDEKGALPAFSVNVVDATGGSDAFHGAFAAGLALGMQWNELLNYDSAAGALCCTALGARLGLPTKRIKNCIGMAGNVELILPRFE